MKIKQTIHAVFRVVAFGVIALLLLLCALLIVVYSPWAQELAREAIVNKIDGRDGGTAISVDAFRLKFPLKIDATRLAITQAGDTMLAAGHADVKLAVMPLFKGDLKVKDAVLTEAVYRINNPDSAMYLTIDADTLTVKPGRMKLSTMNMDFGDVSITHGMVALYLGRDTVPPAPDNSDPSTLKINVKRINMNDFTYKMRLMPVIDTIYANVGKGYITDGLVDLGDHRIAVKDFFGTHVDARYITPDSAAILRDGPYDEPEDTTVSKPWTITVDSIDFRQSHGMYATANVVPEPGMDFSYLEVNNMDLRLHDFLNCKSTVILPLSLSGRERCGLDVSIVGDLDINSEGLDFKDFTINTPKNTHAFFNGYMGTGSLSTDPTLPLRIILDGVFAPEDVATMFPALDLYMNALPKSDLVHLDIKADGTSGRLNVADLNLRANRCLSLWAAGNVDYVFNPDRLGGNIRLKGNIINITKLKDDMLDAEAAKSLNIPPMTLAGNVAMNYGKISGDIKATTAGGDLRLDAKWNSRGKDYDIDLSTHTFPVAAFMPDMEVGSVTAKIKGEGHGYDVFDSSTHINASVSIPLAEYKSIKYTDITAKVKLADGLAHINVNSDDPDAELSLQAHGNLSGDVYNWTANIDGRYIDLQALDLAADPASLELTARADAIIGPGKNDLIAHLIVNDLFFRQPQGTIALNDVNAHLESSDSLTNLSLHNRDLALNFTSPISLDSISTRFGSAADAFISQLDRYSLDVDTLGLLMPSFTLDIHGGHSNLVNDVLAPSQMSVRSFGLSADKDSILEFNAFVNRLETSSLRLDSIFANVHQHKEHLHLAAGVRNKPGNMDQWHKIDIIGAVEGNKAALGLSQQNLKDDTGFQLGIRAESELEDSTVIFNIKPFDPIIGYQTWTVNEDNYISYRMTDGHLDANLRMHGGRSSLAVYTMEPQAGDSLARHTTQEDLVLQLSDIHIQDWISFNPFAPPIKGDVTADMRLNKQGDIFVGQGSAGISNLFYGREKVATITTDFDIAASSAGTVNARADLFVDGQKTMTLNGALNDSTSTSPMDLDFALIHFPLNTINPFISEDIGTLEGTLNGKMKISGTDKNPIMNGKLDFDSTAIRLALTGTPYRFSEAPINVTNSVVDFENFNITACNNNPLSVNGQVNLANMSDIRLNLGLKANNMQIVNTNRPQKGADVYGRAFVSLDANVHGGFSLLNVNAKATINSGTNVTYVLPDATTALANKSNQDMVKFVNFTDTLAVMKADSLVNNNMALLLDANLVIENGTTINVDLSADGKNRVQVECDGNLDYTISPLQADGRLMGRINIDGGFVRYTPPLLSEKFFKFKDNCYISFNGNMMDPTVNLNAVDVIKANVTASGQNSRLVYFDVLLSATGTLNRLDVKFDLSTDDDMTVANELESMSAQQRANQAMNMLLYNAYTGPGTKADASMSGNPIFSFLASQINNWAASNIRGVDISFGVNSYDRTVNGNTSLTTSYSYQVSKSLFNDRFKIVVGGNYSTDANVDENFQQNLINDISFEYFLNRQRTMYLRLFRHTGYESILEGEITQTGLGFVYRRKLRKLIDMLLPTKVIQKSDASGERVSYPRPSSDASNNKSESNQ